MIPNHQDFIEAIQQRKKVRIQFYSAADHGVLDRVCSPLDYGSGSTVSDGLNRYWMLDDDVAAETRVLGLFGEQIVRLQVMGEAFETGNIGEMGWAWSIPRDWAAVPLPFGGEPKPISLSILQSLFLVGTFASAL